MAQTAMQKLGQHFLKNKSALQLIVDALDLQPEETIIEIGPGHGELTVPLMEECAKKNCKLVAVEKDEKLKIQLEISQSEKLKTGQLEIKSEDILKILPELAAPPYKITGNIPYYITGHLLRIIGELSADKKPKRCIFTIQKEVAERISATAPHMNRLAASVQFWAKPKILKSLPASDFSPPPKVDSAILQLVTKEKMQCQLSSEKYYAAVRVLFAQPRKTILNNLGKGITKQEAIKLLGKLGINPSARPQNLSVKDIMGISSG